MLSQGLQAVRCSQSRQTAHPARAPWKRRVGGNSFTAGYWIPVKETETAYLHSQHCLMELFFPDSLGS